MPIYLIIKEHRNLFGLSDEDYTKIITAYRNKDDAIAYLKQIALKYHVAPVVTADELVIDDDVGFYIEKTTLH